jgi:hypothetical protein
MVKIVISELLRIIEISCVQLELRKKIIAYSDAARQECDASMWNQ